MAFGKWIGNLKGLFNDGPMKELTEEVLSIISSTEDEA